MLLLITARESVLLFILYVEICQAGPWSCAFWLWCRPTVRACWHVGMWDQFGQFYYWGGDYIDDYIRHLLRPDSGSKETLNARCFVNNFQAVLKEELIYRLGAYLLSFVIGHTWAMILWSGLAFAFMHNWYAWDRWTKREHARMFVGCFISGCFFYVFLLNPAQPFWMKFGVCLLIHYDYNHLTQCWWMWIARTIVKHLRLSALEDTDLKSVRELRTLASLERIRGHSLQ